jgi:hypothetical protein
MESNHPKRSFADSCLSTWLPRQAFSNRHIEPIVFLRRVGTSSTLLFTVDARSYFGKYQAARWTVSEVTFPPSQ